MTYLELWLNTLYVTWELDMIFSHNLRILSNKLWYLISTEWENCSVMLSCCQNANYWYLKKIYFFTEQRLVRNHSNVVGMEIKTEIGDWTDCYKCQKIHFFTEQQLVRNHSNVVGMKSDVIGCSVTVTIIFLEFPFFVKQQHLKIMNIFTLKMITMFMYSIFNFTYSLLFSLLCWKLCAILILSMISNFNEFFDLENFVDHCWVMLN